MKLADPDLLDLLAGQSSDLVSQVQELWTHASETDDSNQTLTELVASLQSGLQDSRALRGELAGFLEVDTDRLDWLLSNSRLSDLVAVTQPSRNCSYSLDGRRTSGGVRTIQPAGDYSGAYIWCAIIQGDATDAKFDSARLLDSEFAVSSLRRASFRGAKAPSLSMRFMDLRDADFSGATFGYVDFENSNLAGADFSSLDLSDASFDGARSGGIKGTPKAMPPGYRLINGFIVGPGTDLTNADLSNADLRNMDLSQTTLENTNLLNANLSGVSSGAITGTPIGLDRGFQLSDGYLIGPEANLTRANLTNVAIAVPSLAGAKLGQAVLTGASFADDTDLLGVQSGGIVGKPARLPAHTAVSGDGFLIGRGATITGANVSGLDLRSVDFEGTTSGGMTADRTTQWPETPKAYGIANGYVVGPSVNLRAAQLQNTYALRYVDLSSADLTGADLTGSDLEGVGSSDTQCATAHLPVGYQCRSQFILGPGVNLRGRDLRKVNFGSSGGSISLAEAVVAGSNFGNADLSQVILTGIYSGTVSGNVTLPAGWVLKNGYLIGPGVDVTGVAWNGTSPTELMDWSGVDFTKLDYQRVNTNTRRGMNLDYTDLRGATLVSCYLTGGAHGESTITGADLRGASWTARCDRSHDLPAMYYVTVNSATRIRAFDAVAGEYRQSGVEGSLYYQDGPASGDQFTYGFRSGGSVTQKSCVVAPYEPQTDSPGPSDDKYASTYTNRGYSKHRVVSCTS